MKLTGSVFAVKVAEDKEASKDDDDICNGDEDRSHCRTLRNVFKDALAELLQRRICACLT